MAALKSVASISPAKRKRQMPGEAPSDGRIKPKFGGGKKPKVSEGYKGKSEGYKGKSEGSKGKSAGSGKFTKGKNFKDAPKVEGKFIKSKTGKPSVKSDGNKGLSARPLETETGPEKPLDRKARKELAEFRKSQRRPNYELEKEIKNLWEKMRQRDLEAAERSKLVTETLTKMKGKLLEMGMSHISSRVLQSCVKHCKKPERDAVFEELRPHILALTRETYAYHLVIKMLDHANKTQLQQILAVLHGNVVSLLRHPVGSAVVEHAYHLANGTQKKELVSEFYSPEFRLFKGVEAVKGGVKELMAKGPISKQNSTLEHMMMSIQPILEKGIIDHSITHRALFEYLSVCKRSMVEDVVKSLAGPLILRMIHTRDGARVGVTCINMSTAKERKNIIRAMKGHVNKIANDEHSSIVLLAILDLVDDTKLVSKVIITELLKDLKETIVHKYGRRCVLQLLAPGIPRYFPADVLEVLQHPVGVNLQEDSEQQKEFTKEVAPADEVDAPLRKKKKAKKEDGEKEGEGEDAEDMEEDDGVKEVRGVSKKDPAVRRQEILTTGGFGKKLVESCTEMANEMLQSPVGTDVIYEVAMGGIDGVLWKIAAEEVLALHKAIADLASTPKPSEDEKVKGEHVLEQYFASRTIRRLVVNSKGSPHDNKAVSFSATLYADALKGNCKLWAKDHSAKVISAYTICADTRAKKAAHAEIQKLVDAGLIKKQES